MKAISVDDELLQVAVQLTGLQQEQALETALKLLISVAQTRRWQQESMDDPQLILAAQEFLKQQWVQCSVADLDQLL
jgi:hypothetical protein